MDDPGRQLVLQVVGDHLREAAPDLLPTLEAELATAFEALPEPLHGDEGEHPGGLRFDFPTEAWTAVTAAIWISINLVTEAVRHRKERNRERALDRLETLLADQMVNPVLVHELRGRLEEALARMGNLTLTLAPGGATGTKGEARAGLVAIRTAGPSAASVPDLEIVIRRERRDGREHLVFELTAGDPDLRINHLRFTSSPFERSPGAHVGDLLPGIANLPLDYPNDRAAVVDQLSAIGSALAARLLPADLEAKLWSLRGRVATVQIQSEEPSIPWELLKLRSPDPDPSTEEPFLCEAFAVARWLLGCPRVTRLPMRSVAVVVPRDANVGQATPEIEELLRRADAGRVVERIPALATPVVQALASGHYDGWYFAAHGEAKSDDPEAWELRLEDHQRFPVRLLEDRARGLGQAQPLVFLNCCHSGRAAMALTGTGGWSSGFLRAGAGAFIGCYWAVDDQKAHELARELYQRFLVDHLPLGEAFREARLWLRKQYPGDPTWLAYTLFGHPLARCGEAARSVVETTHRGAVPSFGAPQAGGPPSWLTELTKGKAWTDKHEHSLLSGRLAEGGLETLRDLGLQLLRLILPSDAEWPRGAVVPEADGHTLFVGERPYPLVVQWQAFAEPGEALGKPHAERCRKAAESFLRRREHAAFYLLIHNRDERNPELRDGLAAMLRQVTASGLVSHAESWGRQQLLRLAFHGMHRLALAALGAADLSPAPLGALAATGQPQPIREVPLRTRELVVDQHRLTSHGEPVLQDADPAQLVLDSEGTNLSLLLGEFGFGKTTALARALVERGSRQVLFVPGARITSEVKGTKDLVAQCFNLDQLFASLPEEGRATYLLIARAVLEYMVKDRATPLAFVLDGLDESAFLGQQGGLQRLFNCLVDLRVPVVLSMRTEFWLARQAEFGASVGLVAAHGEPRFRKVRTIDLLPWGPPQIRDFVARHRQAAGDPVAFGRLAELEESMASGSFAELYGDIPRRPLFLRFIVESVAADGMPTRRVGRAALVRDWTRRKILRDLLEPARQGGARGPLVSSGDSAEKELELAWQAMTSAAALMTRTDEGHLELTEDCDLARVLAASPGLARIHEELPLFLKSLLLPTGPRWGDRPVRVRFAHRAFQEFFLAWSLLTEGSPDRGTKIPDSVAAWADDIRAEGLVGGVSP